ncbi:chromatin remodeling 8 isoform X2 [Tasmannia lanceolata]|uniref:chromatin remodeling 8 isoform X2 n=1 Tax=Tasmannia lanceolata TaxID=3420 RepID=UPI0040636F87
MEEDEEDRYLLSSLGVTSANPEDIERDILTEVGNDGEGRNEAEESIGRQFLDEEHTAEPSSTSRVKLRNKLRAVEFEINAVAASVEQAKNVAETENNISGRSENREEGDTEASKDENRVAVNGLTLQHALATDRLRSLKKTKAQLQKNLNNLDKYIHVDDDSNEKLLGKLVKDEVKHKQRLKDVRDQGKDTKKRKKAVAFDDDLDFDAVLDAASAGFVETERDELVRKGILTPFHKLKGFERRLQQPGSLNSHALQEEDTSQNHVLTTLAKAVRSISEAGQARPTTKLLDAKALPKLEAPTRPFHRLKTPIKLPVSPGAEKFDKKKQKLSRRKRPLPDKKWRKGVLGEENPSEGSDDDAGENSIASDYEEDNQEENEDTDDSEPSFVTLEGGLKIPEYIFTQLFDYQKVGVQWLWELHCQRAGGIIGDEMGLGKTVQVLAFLGALHFSKMYKPSIVICPVTLLRQWRREARKWYPSFRVEILHDSARVPTNRKKRAISDETDNESDNSLDNDNGRKLHLKTSKKWDFLIDRLLRSDSGLLITTYEQLRLLGEKLLDIEWGYAILDEGHRIRNPNADVTLVCKQLQTVHRIIMSGAPIQNKLTELWSLFDFVFPGKLGVLPVFEMEFAVPISVGGYANATPLQVSTAYRCAVVLRDLIMPYLLRRMKTDVNAQLPKKTEHVLFCSLTPEQRSIYRAFLASSEVEQIFDGNRNSLYGIDVMRKICNHPDLLEREHSGHDPDYGNPDRSGKMKVVAQVLKVWKDQGHRVLLFTQTQQMLDIFENFLIEGGYTYRRMDGLTPARHRMALMDEFNNSSDVFVFILTTKVGGLGTNLTGANRVIIFDPDWNPSTDMQSAMNHDAIVNLNDGETMRLEEQASQVAKRAVEALRESRMLRSRDNISVPTWTGRSGAAGAPSSVRRKFGSTVNSQLLRTSKPSEGSNGSGPSKPNGFAAGASMGKALSSAELLARIRETQGRADSDGLEHQFGLASGSNQRAPTPSGSGTSKTGPNFVQPEVLIDQLCIFMQLQGGNTSSNAIVQHFKDKIPSKDLPLFKDLLKEIAVLEKKQGGSTWVLKPEYHQQGP